MAITEVSGLMKYKDSEGNVTLLLPITTKDNVEGLENVDNTADADKPVSTEQAIAIADAKQAGIDAQNDIRELAVKHDAFEATVSGNLESVNADIQEVKEGLGDLSTKNIAERTDLSEDVRASLDKADSAIQSLDGMATEKFVTEAIGNIPTPDVSGQITTHNTSDKAHNDIRLLITGLTDRFNTLANSDDATLDQMKEIVSYIKSNKSLINGITTSKVNVADIIDNLSTNAPNHPLSAAQGVALKGLVDALQEELEDKAGSGHDHIISDIGGLQDTLDRIANTYLPKVDLPASLKNPKALTINGKVYDGSEEVNIEISGGSTNEVNALGQTPLTLTEAANIKLVADGECSYVIESSTVADAATGSMSATSASLNKTDEYIEFKSTGGAAWYASHVDITMSGLVVGEKYRLILDLSTIQFDAANYIFEGHYILKDSRGSTLVTANMGTGITLHNYEFTATTDSVVLVCYPSGGSSFTSGKSIARATDIYINRSSGGTTRTKIFNKAGTFTDAILLGEIPKGITIKSTPSCVVYSTSTIGDEITSGATSPLTGKTVVCFGDSLFGMFRGSGSAPAYVAKRTGATVHNVGFGGCRMSVHPTTGYAAFSMWALAKAIAENDWTTQDAQASSGSDYFPEQLATLKGIDFNSVDAIVIHYGTNDFTAAVSINSTNNPTDYNTLCGALRYSVEKLLNAYPNLRIFVSVPAFRYWTADSAVTYSDAYTNANSKTLVDFVDALANTAKEYNLPVIDSYYGLGINKINASTFLEDGVHHSVDGRKRFGGYIGSRMIAEF